MSINHAILGVLSRKSMTGYDLKKIMQSSPFMHWSGNNNQIYKALVQLKEDGFVSNETFHQEGSPSKKVYSITESGKYELHKWCMSMPEIPELRNTFLIQLAWSHSLSNSELNKLILTYESEVNGKIEAIKLNSKKEQFSQKRSERESLIWNEIYKNALKFYENEIDWLINLKNQLNTIDTSQDEVESAAKNNQADTEKSFSFVINKEFDYVEILTSLKKLEHEKDAITIIRICVENQVSSIIIHDGALSDAFLNLGTGIASQILQKFTMYNIKTALIVDKKRTNDQFSMMANKLKLASSTRVFDTEDEAKNWIVKGGKKYADI